MEIDVKPLLQPGHLELLSQFVAVLSVLDLFRSMNFWTFNSSSGPPADGLAFWLNNQRPHQLMVLLLYGSQKDS